MKKFVIAACLVALSPVVLAETDYVARLNEDGKYCARVKTTGLNGLTQTKTFCRTLKQWEAKGYTVGAKEVSEVTND